jgi:hypothetical protein
MSAPTSSDRELLELAAKAAGYEINFDEPVNDWYPHGYDENGDVDKWWNARLDDGDALRLAAKLRIDIDHGSPLDNSAYIRASRCGIEMVRDPVSSIEEIDGDSSRSASMCLAILRVAAQIGKAMP